MKDKLDRDTLDYLKIHYFTEIQSSGDENKEIGFLFKKMLGDLDNKQADKIVDGNTG